MESFSFLVQLDLNDIPGSTFVLLIPHMKHVQSDSECYFFPNLGNRNLKEA